MDEDYRRTKYCPDLSGIIDRKKEVEKRIKKDHMKAEDMHTYLSNNEASYKRDFIEAYNGKCAYCGISIQLVPKDYFEIDHFIYKKSSKFETKKNAGSIENLVLACHECNHNKGSFIISDEIYDKLYPDSDEIKKTFYRDEMFYIRVSESLSDNDIINEFYERLKLGAEIHRIDYLLMSIIGMQKKYEKNKTLYEKLARIIDILRLKRNIM